MAKAAKLWGGRFKKRTHPEFEFFSSSLENDWKLAPYDIRASIEHARMLGKARLLAPSAVSRLVKGLNRLAKELEGFKSEFASRRYEDIHSFIEAKLVKWAGPDAKRLHAGRSRNDQVSQATRMYVKDSIRELAGEIRALQKAIWAQAKTHADVAVAGMTHLQKAQPVLLGHWFLSYLEPLERTLGQLDGAFERADVLSLGSGALSGSSLPLNREALKKSLGFAELSRNSLDAVGSRDYLAEYLFVLTSLSIQFSRMAEDFLIWQLEDVRQIEMPEDLCTGSSMMPQKKNADFLELTRGMAGWMTGNLVSLLGVLKGLPSSYNRDLQWDKTVLFESTDRVRSVTRLMAHFFDGIRLGSGAKTPLDALALCATDAAETLVKAGVAFRDAHEAVGKFVRFCLDRSIGVERVSSAEWREFFAHHAESVRRSFDVAASIQAKDIPGGTASRQVKARLGEWSRLLNLKKVK